MLLEHSQSQLISERLIYKLGEFAIFCEQGGRGHHKARATAFFNLVTVAEKVMRSNLVDDPQS